jgi:hypothetical protein
VATSSTRLTGPSLQAQGPEEASTDLTNGCRPASLGHAVISSSIITSSRYLEQSRSQSARMRTPGLVTRTPSPHHALYQS